MNNLGVKSVSEAMGRSDGPISVGIGFVALDLLIKGKERVLPNSKNVGGSCGNVMAILAYFRWNSFPVARLGKDTRSKALIRDFQDCQVQTTFISRESKGVTPTIIVRVVTDQAGVSKSRFEWKDPRSGDWLPRYRPYPKTLAKRVALDLPDAKLFYFDRAEPSSLLMAQSMKEKGAVIFFEPSRAKDENIFRQCVEISDVVKYSSDRILKPLEEFQAETPRIEIQTLGSDGLRYRLKGKKFRNLKWSELPAFKTEQVVDPTGCGDWCSAGIISKLCSEGREVFFGFGRKEIKEALEYGQALASLNCAYEGARGPMYSLSVDELMQEVEDLLT